MHDLYYDEKGRRAQIGFNFKICCNNELHALSERLLAVNSLSACFRFIEGNLYALLPRQ